MIKLVSTLKRKRGLSTAAFRDYYESTHRLIGEKYLRDYAVKYQRRYLEPLPGAGGDGEDMPFDVILELWFEDSQRLQAFLARLQEPEVAQEIALDEENLFDRSQKHSYLLTECESQLPAQADSAVGDD
ncbi:MAG: EthD domain-containing protein [Halioglobus sp.]|nr:EthD domain-containing protein [Halioglobus sp.]